MRLGYPQKRTSSKAHIFGFIIIASLVFGAGYKINETTSSCQSPIQIDELVHLQGGTNGVNIILNYAKIPDSEMNAIVADFKKFNVFSGSSKGPDMLATNVFQSVFADQKYPSSTKSYNSAQTEQLKTFVEAANYAFEHGVGSVRSHYEKSYLSKLKLLENGDKVKSLKENRAFFIYSLNVLALNYKNTVLKGVGKYYYNQTGKIRVYTERGNFNNVLIKIILKLAFEQYFIDAVAAGKRF